MEVINTSKSRKTTGEKKREHTKICLLSSVQYRPSLGERAALRSTIMMSNFTKEISMGYKNKSPV